jgi:flavin-dependent thymidylate synthase
MMKVILAGYNVDREVIEELKRHSPPRQDITPETLSASYARISRDPRPVDELRAVARREVEKARRSNQNIIFKMGHHSVAEHAVFNFDIIGVSRLAIEEIEKFRLCSYTEKSQRYITLKDDFVVPEEIKKANKEEIFVSAIRAQNALYHKLCAKLKPYFFEKNRELAKNPKNHPLLEGWAKEDSRYVVSLATEGQLGMTLNARNLELLIRRFASKQMAELTELNLKLYSLAKEVAPSIILFTEANDFDSKTYVELEEKAQLLLKKKDRKRTDELVRLVDFTVEADERILASILHTASSFPFDECFKKAQRLKPEEKRELIKLAFKYMEFYDFPVREFEFADLTFDLIISVSCFAQLKRHRMATLTSQRYDPELGVTVPPSIEEIGAKCKFMEIMERTNKVYFDLKKDVGLAAEYVLTNAHRRRVLLKVNARELYHISRLREDATAQWDIRALVGKMSKQAEKVMPLTCLLLGGKDAYPGLYKRVFGRNPKFFPPDFIQ